MKRILFAAAALAAFGFSSSAMAAATAEARVQVSGTVANTCTLAATETFSGTGANKTAADAVFLTLADETNATLKASNFEMTFKAMCNSAHEVTLRSTKGGLVQTNETPVDVREGTFIKRIGYEAKVIWAATPVVVAPSTNVGTSVGQGEMTARGSVTGAKDGDLRLQVAVTAVNTPVVSGTFSDTLTINIGTGL
jgi:hypothetical protein